MYAEIDESQRSAGQRQAPEPQSSEPRTGAQEHDLPRAEPYGIPRDVEAWIDKEFVTTNAPSLTMAVAKDGRLLWSRAWGWADKEQRVQATPRTPYIVASVSKAITATTLFTLVERGAIDLDAPIEQYLGGVRLRVPLEPAIGLTGDGTARTTPARDATARRVLSHTSGLAAFQNVFFADELRRPPPPPLIDTIRRYGLIVQRPGERFVYSNLGYSILGHAIATVSGQTLATVMQREVFEPLGMTRSALGTPPVSASAVPASSGAAPAVSVSPAISYALDGSRLPAFEQSTTAASSVFASAEDLVRFGLLHVKALAPGQRAILSNRTIDMMQQRVAPSPFGMGWYVFDGPATGVVFHSGGMDGASAVVFLVPAQRLVVVGLCSTMIDLPGRSAEQIINRLVPGVRLAPPSPPAVAAEPIPSSLTGEWMGELLAPNGAHPFRLSIDANGHLRVSLDDRAGTEIVMPEWRDRELHGTIIADIGADDLRKPYRLRFQLTPTSTSTSSSTTGSASPSDSTSASAPIDRLAGPVTAWSFRQGRGADALPMYATLHRDRAARARAGRQAARERLWNPSLASRHLTKWRCASCLFAVMSHG